MFRNIGRKNYLSLLGAVLLNIVMSGCTTYGKNITLLDYNLSIGDYEGAKIKIQKNLDVQGKDRLLYHMEIGLIEHLNGEYQASNRSFDLAEKISETLETRKILNLLKIVLTNPRQGNYRGNMFERVFIHYYKALNYTLLAIENLDHRQSFLEDARVETRKVDITLTALQNEKGNYQNLKDRQGSLFVKLMKIFDALQGQKLDKNWLVYREDAYIRYMNGLIYELNDEFDDARISYQRAANLYEKGYATQYSLGSEITEQAWFDTIRMMKRAGGFENEWSDLSEKKLSKSMRIRLKAFNSDTAQLILITHLGTIPKRQEMNIHLTLDKQNRELILRPILTGTRQEKNDQAAWFYTMYADRGLLPLISNYHNRGLHGAVKGLRSKRVGIGAVWNLAQNIKLPKALELFGARVTVPYYKPQATVFSDTDVWVDGKKQGVMIKAESLAQLALQEQLLSANSDLKMALGRELSKNILCIQVDDLVFQVACKLLMSTTSQSETRNWLTLPYAIEVQRIPVEPGVHHVRLSTRSKVDGSYQIFEHEIKVNKGGLFLLQKRVFAAPEER